MDDSSARLTEHYARQRRLKDATDPRSKITPADKSKFATLLHAELEHGNYAPTMGSALNSIAGVLTKLDLGISDILNANSFIAGNSRQTFRLERPARSNDPFSPGPAITNSLLVFSWHKMGDRHEDKFEITAYLS